MELNINSTAKLNDGVEIPRLGFGTYLIKDKQEAENSVLWALEAGYRHIDTATFYHNEKSIGEAVRKSGIPRGEIFVTTKLWNDDQGYDSALKAFNKSLKNLNIDYIDLYLIHWPLPEKRMESWKALVEIKDSGRCKSIGVSNYTIKHLTELFNESDVIPSVNQVEFHPFVYQKELLEFCNSKQIQLEAYSPLARAKKLKDKRVVEISNKYSETPAQVLIRWSLQHGLVVIPKTSNKERIKENCNVFDFELSSEDMQKLDSLNENYRVAWNPEEIG